VNCFIELGYVVNSKEKVNLRRAEKVNEIYRQRIAV